MSASTSTANSKDIDYSKGVIYEIVCNDSNITNKYYGSTVDLEKREKEHKRNCRTPTDEHYNFKVYKYIREHGGFANWVVKSVKEYPCESDLELRMEEQTYIELDRSMCLNDRNAYLSKENKRIAVLSYKKKHYYNNREKIIAYKNIKHTCECGGKYTNSGKATHTKTNKHQNYLQTKKKTSDFITEIETTYKM
jgi:hypothetical protein